MTSKENVLHIMRQQGRAAALQLQERADTMSGTELYAEDYSIPTFAGAKQMKNMIDRPVGFVCKSSAGRVVRLLQPYDSDVFKDEPEDLPAQWGFKWSADPAKAHPFVAIATSPYMKGDCCTEDGVAYRSMIDNNVHSPKNYPAGWEICKEGNA